MLVYIISLVLMAVNSQNVIESCMVVGFVGVQNAQRNISPVSISDTGYYSPVKYPGLLTEHAASESDCARMIKMFTIIFGVIIFVVQLVQVKLQLYKIYAWLLTLALDLFRICCRCLCQKIIKWCTSS